MNRGGLKVQELLGVRGWGLGVGGWGAARTFRPRSSVAALEIEAQRELDVALAILRGHFSKRGAGRVIIRPAPVGMIERVEGLRAELEAFGLRDCKLLIQSDIPILETRIVDSISNVRLKIECALCGCAENR